MGTKDKTLLSAVAQNSGFVLNVLNGVLLAGNAFLKSRKPYEAEKEETFLGGKFFNIFQFMC